MASQLRGNEIREALKAAHFCTVAREVQRETRPRLTGLPTGGVTPLAALETWFESQKTSPERRRTLMEHAEKLLREEGANR